MVYDRQTHQMCGFMGAQWIWHIRYLNRLNLLLPIIRSSITDDIQNTVQWHGMLPTSVDRNWRIMFRLQSIPNSSSSGFYMCKFYVCYFQFFFLFFSESDSEVLTMLMLSSGKHTQKSNAFIKSLWK